MRIPKKKAAEREAAIRKMFQEDPGLPIPRANLALAKSTGRLMNVNRAYAIRAEVRAQLKKEGKKC